MSNSWTSSKRMCLVPNSPTSKKMRFGNHSYANSDALSSDNPRPNTLTMLLRVRKTMRVLTKGAKKFRTFRLNLWVSVNLPSTMKTLQLWGRDISLKSMWKGLPKRNCSQFSISRSKLTTAWIYPQRCAHNAMHALSFFWFSRRNLLVNVYCCLSMSKRCRRTSDQSWRLSSTSSTKTVVTQEMRFSTSQ